MLLKHLIEKICKLCSILIESDIIRESVKKDIEILCNEITQYVKEKKKRKKKKYRIKKIKIDEMFPPMWVKPKEKSGDTNGAKTDKQTTISCD